MPIFIAQIAGAAQVAGAGQLSGAPTDLVPPLWRLSAGFLAVLAVLALLAWIMRRTLAARRAKGTMNVETALSLGERRSLVIVTVEGRRLLLGVAAGHVSLVTELGAPSFTQSLNQSMGQSMGQSLGDAARQEPRS